MMSRQVRWYSYVGALLLGLAVIFVMTPFLRVQGAALLKRLILFWAVCAALGAFLGLVWPAKGWRWGLWLVGPFWVLGALSFLFTGGVHLLLTKDIPQLAIAAVVECGGAYIGARLRQ